jgi:hypothetical protein
MVGLCEDSSKTTRRAENKFHTSQTSQNARTVKMYLTVQRTASTRTLDSTNIFNVAGTIEQDVLLPEKSIDEHITYISCTSNNELRHALLRCFLPDLRNALA